MKDVTKEIEWFRTYLNSSYSSLGPFIDAYNWDQYHMITADWMRMSWQVLVANVLLEKPNHLKPLMHRYKGYYDKNIVHHFAIVTVIKNSLNDVISRKEIPINIPLLVDSFVTQVEHNILGKDMGLILGSFPPFDCVELLSMDDKTYCACFNDLKFFLIEENDFNFT